VLDGFVAVRPARDDDGMVLRGWMTLRSAPDGEATAALRGDMAPRADGR